MAVRTIEELNAYRAGLRGGVEIVYNFAERFAKNGSIDMDLLTAFCKAASRDEEADE